MQSKQILLTLVAFAFAFAHANPVAASQDTSAKLPCTYTEYVGGPRVRDETHAKEVTTTIDSRWKCVYAAYLLDFCGCSSRDAPDRSECRYACSNRCANDCLGGKS